MQTRAHMHAYAHTHIYTRTHMGKKCEEREKVGREGEEKNLESLNTAFMDNKKPGNNVLNTCTFALTNMQEVPLATVFTENVCEKHHLHHTGGLSRPSCPIRNKSALWATIGADRTTDWAQPQLYSRCTSRSPQPHHLNPPTNIASTLGKERLSLMCSRGASRRKWATSLISWKGCVITSSN